jgi:hypothetical protein
VRLILCLLLMVQATTLSAQYQDGPIRLAVPAEFTGPDVLTPESGAKIVNFVRPIPGTERGTVLQITTFEPDSAEWGVLNAEDVDPTELLLDEFLGGVERRRERFEVVSRDRIELSGLPAARGEWRGVAGGRDMKGVIHSVIVGSHVVVLATQTFTDAPEDHLPAALQAIESVVLQP